MKNSFKTVLLLGLLTGVLLYIGQLIGGRNGLMIGLAVAVVFNFGSYFFSDKIALASYSAQSITPQDHPQIYARVYPLMQNLTQRMGVPMPKLWLIPDPSPNAFATGRNPQHASVAFTEGILGLMTDRELEGVVAHELGHVLHRDILISSVAATLGGAITMLAHFGYFFGARRDDDEEGSGWGGILMLFLAPIAASLIQLAISRSREFSADEASVKYTGSPDGLINALRKLERGVQAVPMDANQATAHLFIVNPFSGTMWGSTHPSTEQRIARLEAMRFATVR